MKDENSSQKIIEYIWSLDLSDLSQITRTKIADKFMINESYLSRKFKKDTKMLLSKFIQMIKIKRAEELIKTRYDLSIKEISKLVGILKVEHFRKNFKKNNGLNPLKYRRIHKM